MLASPLSDPDCPRDLLRARIAQLEEEVAILRTARARVDGWSIAEDEILRHGCERRYAFEVIRAELIAKGFPARSTSNIRYRAKELGVAPTSSVRLWTDAEDAIVRERYEAGDPIKGIRKALLAAGFNRRFGAVQMRLIHLGISGERSLAWTADEERIAIAALAAGKPHRQIVEELGKRGFTRTLAGINKLADKHDLLRVQRPWTDEDRARLRELWATDMPGRTVAEMLGRPLGGTISMASKLGLRRHIKWTKAENEILIEAAKSGGRLIDATATIGRPYINVAAQARRLGLSFQKTRAAA
jgi:hypothetical protein